MGEGHGCRSGGLGVEADHAVKRWLAIAGWLVGAALALGTAVAAEPVLSRTAGGRFEIASVDAGGAQRVRQAAEEAWRWLRHLGSPACQQRVAEGGVVFPAVRGMAEVAVRAQARMGVDSQVFLDAARGLTYPPPIAPRAAEVNDLMDSTLEGILSGRRPAGPALLGATRQVREITRQP